MKITQLKFSIDQAVTFRALIEKTIKKNSTLVDFAKAFDIMPMWSDMENTEIEDRAFKIEQAKDLDDEENRRRKRETEEV